ncbi:2-iminoacetate synthase ThiH [Candidatus Methylacidiphilum fumarolicum]|jgi:2-iminoacetate synthase|uniref:Thiamine biosynthesis enzyme ThiH n=2 Tax=Candidatus Methylacidiphilum fumarolicum TaxID=591154 RepID=I0JZA8_METFB|nr:2-iminoacetate synthase ThiH [Candidatus Methylacidiphilum fumarolicum]MBW6414731.1 2-iminoacetate synthase ThiH [Candidatus Methylacidiphilum fumarolicum]TFE70131.1 thiamine biosynthesis protein ThiH [Candidatus Methylacidiphilum fumarolicum]TFE74301.1 2-iminoacetate synthase ThiH [Candidatus Methylacidiphilum fumarolicum]TFE75800.1 2-iminoacetate synthase ThiH [Candidatus Methylacidiphilum fumarolicum]TFE75960.1 thiamine biosynthesis protein ThiH [Candidatus Methylacidiphilum fumarolicum]
MTFPSLRKLPFYSQANDRLLSKFWKLLLPKTDDELQALALEAKRITQLYFGKTLRLYAPLYLSNECINSCSYCGFSRDNSILRLTLTPSEVLQEATYLWNEGFRSILLVAGEHPKFVSLSYLEECVTKIRPLFPSIAIEVAPLETAEYERMIEAGVEGVVVYQETYNPELYSLYHRFGPKKDFFWRLESVERAYAAGARRLGIGALFGLAPWKEEALCLAAHCSYLLKKCWRAYLTISLPRLRPAAGGFTPPYPLGDRDIFHFMCAFRVCFPQVGIVLSTREEPAFRERLIPFGITAMSAGSRTEPGGYTLAGIHALHRGSKGKVIALCEEEKKVAKATEQFEISDRRDAKEIATVLKKMGYEPVWKDWESCLNKSKLQ